MRTRRQKIQLELALEPVAKGEARSAGGRGTEARMARADPERPATGPGPSMEAVLQPGNLKKALARARRNRGAPGVDGMTVGDLGAHLSSHWPEIRSRLLDGTYEPQPVRRVEIPKASGGVRPLGVPTVASKQRTCEAHQSSTFWVSVASAYKRPDTPIEATNTCARCSLPSIRNGTVIPA